MNRSIRAMFSVRSSCSVPAKISCVLLSAGAFLLAGCASAPVSTARSPASAAPVASGSVYGGQQPVTGATIQLYAVGSSGDGSASTPLLLTTVTTSDGSSTLNSNANAGNVLNTLPAGAFTITGDYNCNLAPGGSSAEVYLTATQGNPGLAAGANNPNLSLMAALGPCSGLSSSTNIFIDELTTVGSVAALYPYMSSYSAIGSGTADASALQTAFNTVNEYTSISSGSVPGPSLPAGYYASSMEIQTLGDAISSCINSSGGTAGQMNSCGSLFSDATPAGGTAPADTIGALIDILDNPSLNVCPIYSLIPGAPPFVPTLASCPASWSLPINAVTVAVSGASTVYQSATTQYTAAVTGATNNQPSETAVTWQVNGVTGGNTSTGTISASGLYTAPATVPSGPVSISAVSVLTSAAVGSATVTVLPVTAAITGPADVLFGQMAQYSAVVTGTSNQAVTWMVNGVAGGDAAQGTISATGLYTAPASAPSTVVTISAQSAAFSTASASLSLSISGTALTYATGDSRTVTQPTVPAICATLNAQFTTAQRAAASVPAAGSDDTTRIQAALSSSACKNTGKTVELAISGSNNAFYSAELTVTGEGLLIDPGVTLEGNTAYSSQSELLDIGGTNSSLMGPGTVDGRGDIITGTPRLVQTNNAANFIAYNVTLQEAAYPNLYIQGSNGGGNGATVWGVTILTPPSTANADGIDIDSISNATVTNSTIEAGDDGIAVKTNEYAASNITVSNDRLYGTHGLSIGSQTFKGVTNVLFTNNYVYGTGLDGIASTDANAINIKTDIDCGGLVQQVTYQNTCISGAKHLMVINADYGSCSGTAGTPQFQDIIVNGVFSQSSVSGTYSQFTGYSASYPINAYFANIDLDNVNQSSSNQYAGIALDNSNIVPSGTGITTSSFSTPGSVPSCSF